MFDCIIIGSGPAGISASLYIVRAGFKVLVISKSESMLNKAGKIENYYGFREPISGAELVGNGIYQAKRLGVDFLEKEVVSIKFSDEGYYEVIVSEDANYQEASLDEDESCQEAKASQGKNSQETRVSEQENNQYIAKNIILATGISRNKSQIEGLKEFEGRGISYCAICDAAFYKDKDVAVLGSGDYALQEIAELLPIVKSITMLTNGVQVSSNIDKKIKINTKKIKQFKGDKKIREVLFEDGSTLNIDGIFVAEGVASSVDFARKLGAKIENNYIVVDEKMQTNVPHVFACGDCTGGILQISKAVYDGTVAGLEVIKNLKES